LAGRPFVVSFPSLPVLTSMNQYVFAVEPVHRLINNLSVLHDSVPLMSVAALAGETKDSVEARASAPTVTMRFTGAFVRAGALFALEDDLNGGCMW
jgi:hypothetical protein